MIKMEIKYYLDFVEDHRASMNKYAQQLINYQSENFKDLNINFYQPKLSYFSKFIFLNNFKLRYSRYISYPHQVKKLQGHDIAHICDHAYAHLFPYLNSKLKFITVHDLVPLVFQKKLNKNPRLFKLTMSNLKHFTKVFTVSENTKKDILKYTDCPEDKIKVIMESVESFFNTDPIDKEILSRKYNIPINKKKILISGNVFYKNHNISYKVLEKLMELNKEIIFIHIGSGREKINISKKIKNNIIRLPFIDTMELPSIYKLADILLFPSIYEGFGLPPLEAMSCGTPVVCSNNPATKEVVGDAALISSHDDINSFTKNILNLLSNNNLSQKITQKGLLRAKLFNINEFHKNLIQIYRDEFNKLS